MAKVARRTFLGTATAFGAAVTTGGLAILETPRPRVSSLDTDLAAIAEIGAWRVCQFLACDVYAAAFAFDAKALPRNAERFWYETAFFLSDRERLEIRRGDVPWTVRECSTALAHHMNQSAGSSGTIWTFPSPMPEPTQVAASALSGGVHTRAVAERFFKRTRWSLEVLYAVV